MRPRPARGEAVTETVLVFPAALLLVLLVVQFGLWYHAAHLVRAAAAEAARAARAQGAVADDGRVRAERFLVAVAGRSVEAPEVEVERGPEVVRVRVRARAPAVVPGLRLGVRAVAESPVEEFRAP